MHGASRCTRATVIHLGGHDRYPGDQLEHADGWLVHAALELAEVGIRQGAELGQLAEREVRELSSAADEGRIPASACPTDPSPFPPACLCNAFCSVS
jgi:hypothetical protein